jgi:hypothetical protein
MKLKNARNQPIPENGLNKAVGGELSGPQRVAIRQLLATL